MADPKDQFVDKEKMDKMSVAPPDPDARETGREGEEDKEREEEELEEGLEETFPASDPPANTQPGHTRPVPSSGAPDEKKAREKD